MTKRTLVGVIIIAVLLVAALIVAYYAGLLGNSAIP
jgi:hypothetical protein